MNTTKALLAALAVSTFSLTPAVFAHSHEDGEKHADCDCGEKCKDCGKKDCKDGKCKHDHSKKKGAKAKADAPAAE